MEPITMVIIAGLISLGNVIKSKIEKEEREEAERRLALSKAKEEEGRRLAKAKEEKEHRVLVKASVEHESSTKQIGSNVVDCKFESAWKALQGQCDVHEFIDLMKKENNRCH